LTADVLAGLTLVAIAVPEQMATARLASLPEVTGLYAFVAGSLVFAALGRSAQLSVGADSTIAPIVAAAVAVVAVAGTPHYTHLVAFLALMVGVLMVAVGLLRLGWIADLLSTPVVTGVLAGIAVQILVRQIPAVLGLPGGGTTTLGRLDRIGDQLGRTNGWSVAIAVGVFAVITAAEHVDRRIPGALAGLVASLLLSAAFGLSTRGVPVVGRINGGLPSFDVPTASWADIRHLLVPALTIAFVCVVQTAATVRATRVSAATPEDFNHNLAAVGGGSLVAGVMGTLPVDTSPPRTEVVAAAGGRSQLTGAVAAAVVLALVVAFTGVLKDLPEATLGAILVFVATRLFRTGELRAILRFDRVEFAVSVITLFVVAVFGVEVGVVVAMLLALAGRTRRAARPPDVVLGRVPGTEHWIPPDIGRATEQVPGVVVYLIYAPLWYGNADYFRIRVMDILDSAAAPLRVFVLDANGISDIDYTGAGALGEVAAELKRRQVALGVARASHLVHRCLKHSALLQYIGSDHLFSTVEEAVEALTGER
jgi:high affinity sulfate transporter 1